MKKTISLNLPNRLAQYGALSLAIAGIIDANGQVIYTNIADTGPLNQTYNLDLDGGGTFDFFIRHGGGSYGIVDVLPETGGNAIIGRYTYTDIFPFALNNSYTISVGNSNWQSNYQYQILNELNCYNFSSYWCGVTDKFLGLRFEIGADTHYGWARLDVSASGGSWLIKDYAYNSARDLQIDTGEGIPLGIDDELVSKVKIVALNKSIALYNLPESISYKLFTMTGQSVLKGKIKMMLMLLRPTHYLLGFISLNWQMIILKG